MKKKWTIICIIIVVLALILGINHRAVNMIIKNATIRQLPDPEVDNWNNGETYLRLPYSDISESDYLDLFVPNSEAPPPLFVMIHGGGFIFGDSETEQIQRMYSYFRDHGYACASVNYRLAQEAAFPAAVDDCKAAIRFLRANAERYGYEANRILVYGESAGGYLATMCAVTTDEDFHGVSYIGRQDSDDVSAKVSTLVNYYGYTSLTGLKGDLKESGIPKIVFTLANSWSFGKLGGYEDYGSCFFRKNISEMTADEMKQYDPHYYLHKNAEEISDLSVYIIHGDCDLTIPLQTSERLYEDLKDVLDENRIMFRIEPGMGHASDPLSSEDILAEINQFLQNSN